MAFINGKTKEKKRRKLPRGNLASTPMARHGGGVFGKESKVAEGNHGRAGAGVEKDSIG